MDNLKEADALINPDYAKTTKEAYFELLRIWVNQSNMSQNAMAGFPYYLMSNYPQLFQLTGSSSTSPSDIGVFQIAQPNVNQAQPPQRNRFNRNFLRNDDLNYARQEEIIDQHGGYEYIIAPLWKRFLAELVDVAILFLIKVVVMFTIVDLFDINLGIEFDLDAIKNSIEDDYLEILSFTSDLLIVEIITKITVCFYEAIWTAQHHGQGQIGGATPGKMLLGLRIVHVDAVVPIDVPIGPALNANNVPIKALLYPAANPGFKRALCRAIAKNILMVLLFPMCFIMFFFKNNRTGYDIMTRTIVVEENFNPVLRRR